MTARTALDLADELTTRIAAVDGVRSLFPEHAATAAVISLLTGDVAVATGRVRVDTSGETLRITARLATERAVPARTIIAETARAVTEVVGAEPFELALELAYID